MLRKSGEFLDDLEKEFYDAIRKIERMQIFTRNESQEIPQLPGPCGILRARGGLVILAVESDAWVEAGRLERLMRACREQKPTSAGECAKILLQLDMPGSIG